MPRKKKGKGKEEESVQQTEVQTLSPKSVHWDIGGKLFEQKPLRIDRLGDVLEKIVDVILGSGRGAILDQLLDSLDGDEKKAAAQRQSLTPILVRTVVALPKKLPEICALIIPNAQERYLRDHLDARTAIKIVQTFVVQNEIGALIQDFFGLLGSVRLSIEEAATEMEEEFPTTAEEETDNEPSSDTETSDETA